MSYKNKPVKKREEASGNKGRENGVYGVSPYNKGREKQGDFYRGFVFNFLLGFC
jgi:hypothetical protein